MTKAPWFKFWAADYLSSPFVQSLEPEHELWYLRLIIASAISLPRGCLPLATSKLYLLARAKSQEHFEKHSAEILAKFKKDESAGFYVVEKIANQLINHADISKKRADAGKKGGIAKQQNKWLAIARVLPDGLLLDSDSDTKSSSELKGSPDRKVPSEKKIGKLPSQEACRLSALLKTEILRNKADYRITPQQERNWSTTAQRMMDVDKRNAQTIADLIRWVQRDEFWMGNVLSMETLREKFDQLSLKKDRSYKPASHKSASDFVPARPLPTDYVPPSERILQEQQRSAREGAK
jgi:hypothetical protein